MSPRQLVKQLDGVGEHSHLQEWPSVKQLRAASGVFITLVKAAICIGVSPWTLSGPVVTYMHVAARRLDEIFPIPNSIDTLLAAALAITRGWLGEEHRDEQLRGVLLMLMDRHFTLLRQWLAGFFPTARMRWTEDPVEDLRDPEKLRMDNSEFAFRVLEAINNAAEPGKQHSLHEIAVDFDELFGEYLKMCISSFV